MKTWIALLGHELRNARTSLSTSALLTVVLLAILHGTNCLPVETATALPFLWCLCALQFSADSFATDLSSGRLATRATLPVSARELWGVKLLGFVTSMVLLIGVGIALEVAWQSLAGDAVLLRAFLVGLLPVAAGVLTALALIGSAGLLCSLVVESALTAMLLTGLVLASLWGLSLAIDAGERLTGRNFLRHHSDLVACSCVGLFLLIGYLAFMRAQRRLGASAARVRVVLVSGLVAVVGLTGIAGATYWHHATLGLEDPGIQIYPPIASPDGRFIAFETEPVRNGTAPRAQSVWVLDLETGTSELLAGPGNLARNFHNGGWKAWSDEDGLCVLVCSPWDWTKLGHGLRVRAVDGELRKEETEDFLITPSPDLPDWAIVIRKPGSKVVTIRWRDTSFERTFEGRVGYGVTLSHIPGRVLVRREDQLVRIDFASDEEQVLIESGVIYTDLSPDGEALLVRTETHSHVLSTADGSTLHAPWLGKECVVCWIPGDDRSHELWIKGRRDPTPRILDLANNREFEFADGYNMGFARVADRGYVQVDQSGDFVLLDREGKLVKVLVDRRDQ